MVRRRKKQEVIKEPTLVEGLDTSGVVRCLAFDPGTKNFACSIVEGKMVNGKFRFRVVGTRMFENCITEPKAYLRGQSKAFQKEFRKVVKKYGPFDIGVAERFQSRGHGGHTIESINMMLGIMNLEFKGQDWRTITAATWKNPFNKHIDLRGCYADRKTYENPKTDHEFDASMIGVYRLHQVFGLKPFEQYEEKHASKLMDKFIRARQLKV